MLERLRRHWPEYGMVAAGLGIFMISACVFTTIFAYPGSPVRQAVENAFLRRVLMGLAMGLTAISLIYSSWGKQSGAHLNPSVTLTFLRLPGAGWPPPGPRLDPHWRDLVLFYEYFHGDHGSGVGANHQTGWTGLVAKLIQQSGE